MPRPISIARALAIVAALAGCKKSPDEESDTGATPTPETTPAPPPRVPPMTAPELGQQAGYLDGGLVYVAARIDRVQAFAQKLPLPPDAAEELAEAGAFFGLDFRVDDVRARFGIARDAVVSMTIARPLAADAEAVRAELTRGGPFLDALTSQAPTAPKVEIGYRPEEPVPVPLPAEEAAPVEAPPPPSEVIPEPPPHPIPPPEPPIAPIVEPPPPPPPPPQPSLEAVAQAEKFLRKASTLGIHSRIHIPADNPALLAAEMQKIADRGPERRWAEACRAIPGEALCAGDNEMVVVMRQGKSALDVDIVWFATPAEQSAPGRIATVREAVLAPTVDLPHLGSLRGDAAAYLDSNAIEQLAMVDALGGAVRSLEWTPAADRRSTIDRRLERVKAVHDLESTPMLYRGVAFEVVAAGTRVHARLRWDVDPERADVAKKLVTAPEPFAAVPTIDALCQGAVACARTRGLPSPSAWRDELATGVYAGPQRDLERMLDDGDVWAGVVLFAGAWPNFAGAVARWPAQEIGRGPEAAIANNVVDAVGKIEGFGASLRSLSASEGRVQADYAVYARMKKSELDLGRSLLTFAGLETTDTAISGVAGTAQMVRIPEDEVPAALMLFADPERTATSSGPAEYGWAGLVDGADRFGWLLGLPRERAVGPSAYLEVPDLWLLLGSAPEIARELGFARTWFAARHLRVALEIVDGAPHLLATSDVATAVGSAPKPAG